MEVNIVIAGVGGQGVVTAGTLISEAASLAGMNVVMSEIHGMSQRGGSVSVEVRLGDVRSPMVSKGKADLILGLEEIETIRALNKASRDTLVIMSTEKLTPIYLSMRRQEYPELSSVGENLGKLNRFHRIDAVRLARECGDERVAGTVMIGAAIAGRALPFGKEVVLDALADRFSGHVLEANSRALSVGFGEIEVH